MRPLATLVFICTFTVSLTAQFNATLRSNLDYFQAVNDVWGYTAPDGTEYALVGLDRGVSVVSLADPADPVEVGQTTGVFSPWRDIKTYGQYAYVTADRGQDGLTVIDLGNLPESISFEQYTYEVPGFSKPFVRAHNIYIDTAAGLAFTAGGDQDVNDGGVLIFDLKANPAHPPLTAVGPEEYSHDVYVQDSIMYASEIFLGQLTIYDIHDLEDIRLLGSTPTPFSFTHNAWVNEDATAVFVTDEVENAPVSSYDIRNFQDIKPLDEYRPLSSLNTNTIPHNVHVIGDFLSISYYTDGLRVVDATDPANLIEVANYDTWLGPNGGFNGNWGAYPYLPSGLTLVSDRQTGLYVVDVNYKRAARLVGTVTEEWSGKVVNDASVLIQAAQLNQARTNALGNYKTGIATEGTYQVIASASGYFPDTVEVALTAGLETELNITLEPIPTFSDLGLSVRDRSSGLPIDGARVAFTHVSTEYFAQSDSNGRVSIDSVRELNYRIYVTALGYLPQIVNDMASVDINGSVVSLDEGYADSFVTDLGWTTVGSGGINWRRVRLGNQPEVEDENQPTGDSPKDLDDRAYIVSLSGDEPAGASKSLQSPNLDLSDYTTGATVYFDRYIDGTITEAGADSLLVCVRSTTGRLYPIASYTENTDGWMESSLILPNDIILTDSSTLVVTAIRGTNMMEPFVAGFDNFRILRGEQSTANRSDPVLPGFSVSTFPNPSAEAFTLVVNDLDVQVFNLTLYGTNGRVIRQFRIRGQDPITFGNELPSGQYFITVRADGRTPRTLAIIKQ